VGSLGLELASAVGSYENPEGPTGSIKKKKSVELLDKVNSCSFLRRMLHVVSYLKTLAIIL
jgi:hypothetical protein